MVGDISGKMENIIGRINAANEKVFGFKEIKNIEKEIKDELKGKEFASLAISDIRSEIKEDKAKVDELNKAIKEAENKYQSLQQYEEKIHNTIAPMLQNMEDDLRDNADNLNSKSQVTLDVTKWRVQSTLKDMKSQMQHLTQGFQTRVGLARCLEKLEEAVTTLINIYDRIQSYQDQQQLASYIADMSSASASAINISDPNLVRAVNYIETSIKSNIVLNQYKKVFNSFKQWVFPFGSNFLERPLLPSQLELDEDLENLASNAVTHIENMRTKVEIYKTSILINDKYLLRGEFNSRNVSTEAFFVWLKKSIMEV
ncbi:hypothetical protein CDAR_526651 [Caerostris darwini]|uniref:Uncharacterized protein n=1 Tax=Caerostris darwini TaxID=1538125 RepID=A0AAV4Q5A3_9ARAC|nr:hypothetical protein CDAR_526651 [Caerostris darwini]